MSAYRWFARSMSCEAWSWRWERVDRESRRVVEAMLAHGREVALLPELLRWSARASGTARRERESQDSTLKGSRRARCSGQQPGAHLLCGAVRQDRLRATQNAQNGSAARSSGHVGWGEWLVWAVARQQWS